MNFVLIISKLAVHNLGKAQSHYLQNKFNLSEANKTEFV